MMSVFFQKEFDICLVGKANLKTVLPPYLSAWGWNGSLDDFIRTWLDEENAPDQRMIKNVELLRQAGYPCYLATSQETLRADYIRRVMGFENIFDDLFFSCEIGVQKPDPAFYHHISANLNISGDHLLFWDDSLKNVEGARNCGWQAEVFSDIQDFRTRMAVYLSEVKIIASL